MEIDDRTWNLKEVYTSRSVTPAMLLDIQSLPLKIKPASILQKISRLILGHTIQLPTLQLREDRLWKEA
jgi:hypothetical protein